MLICSVYYSTKKSCFDIGVSRKIVGPADKLSTRTRLPLERQNKQISTEQIPQYNLHLTESTLTQAYSICFISPQPSLWEQKFDSSSTKAKLYGIEKIKCLCIFIVYTYKIVLLMLNVSMKHVTLESMWCSTKTKENLHLDKKKKF